MLADITGVSVRSFAYPFGGSVTSELTDILREAGVETAYTVNSIPVTVGGVDRSYPGWRSVTVARTNLRQDCAVCSKHRVRDRH